MRDLRIDFLRGLALIVIFIDHLTDTAFSLNGTHYYFPTLRNIGLCSAAEFFVFFSGYVFGVVYIKNLTRSGLWKCQSKAMARARFIFIANGALFFITAGMTFLFPGKPQTYMEYSDLWLLYSDFWMALAKFATFQYFPVYTDILPLYVVLLVFAPGMLLLLKAHLPAGIALSFAFYVAAAQAPWLNLPLISASGDHWLFDPFSWQLLFVMGIALGSTSTFDRIDISARRTILWAVGFAIGAIAIVKSVAVVGKIFHIEYLTALGFVADVPGMDLRTVGPTRLLYFASLLFLLMGLMPRTESLRRMRWPRPVIACGQKSLEIFCLITLLSELGALLLFEINGNQLSFIVVVASGTLLTLTMGMVLTNAVSISRVLRLDLFRGSHPEIDLDLSTLSAARYSEDRFPAASIAGTCDSGVAAVRRGG